jgi:rod shape-determining protein MreD
MVKNTLFGCLFTAFAVILQTTLFGGIAILGATPDLALLIVVFMAVRNGSMTGQAVGFFTGFFEDFVSAAPIGFHMIMKTLMGFSFGFLKGKFFVDKFLFPLIFGASATVVKALVTNLLALVFSGTNFHPYDFGVATFWVELGYTTVLAPLVFFLLSLCKGLLVDDRESV